MNHIDLDGRSAIVTGGAGRLGRAIVERLMRSGARVMVWDMDEVSLRDAADAFGSLGWTDVGSVDITDFDAVSRIATDAEERLGGVDILVNGAGITCPPMSIDEYRIEDWRRVIDLDLTGVFHCCRAVLPGMIERRYGRVINVASMAGKEGNPLETAYAAAKAGLIGLTKSLGREVASSGVLVNAVAPGIFEQRMQSSTVSDELVDGLISRMAIHRRGRPDELAALIAWMASEECSFTAGFTFDASGGRATY